MPEIAVHFMGEASLKLHGQKWGLICGIHALILCIFALFRFGLSGKRERARRSSPLPYGSTRYANGFGH
jgi:hypothetical protein